MTTMMTKAIAVIVPGSSLLAILQALPADPQVFGQVERLGLVGVLVVAVVVLWQERREEKKNKAIADEKIRADAEKLQKESIAAQIKMAEALVLSTESMNIFRVIIQDLKDTVEHLSSVRETLIDQKHNRS